MFSEPWSDFCIEVKVHKKEEKSLLSSFSEIREGIISEMNILSGTDGIPMSFGVFSPVFLQPNHSSFFSFSRNKMDYLFKLSLLLFLFVLRNSQLSHFRKTFDERRVIKEDFSSVSLCVCVWVCVCMHIQYLSTDSWKQKKIGLLNFPFDLCLSICPLLLWLKFWLTRKILYFWIIDKWLSRDIDAFSFTGMPRSPVQDQVPSY